MIKRIFILSILSCCLTLVAVPQKVSGELIIFHAGSLSIPLKEMIAEFKKYHPEVSVLSEAAGSVASARKITDLERPCDIMMSADYAVIDKMLIPQYADWNIRFAGNELSIVYNEKSRLADKINSKNWYQLLAGKDVATGRADPNSDPCGYRTVLMLQLAEKFYKQNGLAGNILNKDKNYIRPKEVDLIALLESGNIDYIFLYRSVAIQHNLKYVALPDEVNLKSLKFAGIYATSSTEINGDQPGKKTLVRGDPILYGFTILKNAPNKVTAMAFAEFILTKEMGMKIMAKNGQPPLIPSVSEQYEKVPSQLKKYSTKKQ